MIRLDDDGARFGLVLIPRREQVEAGESPIHETIVAHCREAGIPALDLLPALQLFEAIDQDLRTPAASVVDPIIAVGSCAQLTQPTKNDRWRRLDRYTAIVSLGFVRCVEIAREAKPALCGLGSPGLADRHGATFERLMRALSC